LFVRGVGARSRNSGVCFEVAFDIACLGLLSRDTELIGRSEGLAGTEVTDSVVGTWRRHSFYLGPTASLLGKVVFVAQA
jgi:hypothetical protein